MIGPLSLALESCGDGVAAHGFLGESHFGEFGIADHEVPGDESHFDDIVPDLFLP